MKLSRMQIRRLVESILNEDEEPAKKDMGKVTTYIVKSGETLSSIHKDRGAPSATLKDQIELNKEDNSKFNPDKLSIDQKIKLHTDSAVPAGAIGP